MTRPDEVNAKAAPDDGKFLPHPEGQFVAKCVDVIDLGEKVEDFIGKPKKLSPKVVLVFRTGEQNPKNNEVIDVSAEYTVSMFDKANLRKMLEGWRGKQYTEAECDEGVPLHKLVGNWALLTIDHKISGQNRTYARIIGAVGVPKQMRGNLPALDEYTRAPYWAERKAAYLKDAQGFKDSMGYSAKGGKDSDFDDLDQRIAEDEDELPFD